jgi:hypothetical protein
MASADHIDVPNYGRHFEPGPADSEKQIAALLGTE